MYLLYDFTDIDECLVNITCQNGAQCTNKPGGYSCLCTPAFTGKNCSIGKYLYIGTFYDTSLGNVIKRASDLITCVHLNITLCRYKQVRNRITRTMVCYVIYGSVLYK